MKRADHLRHVISRGVAVLGLTAAAALPVVPIATSPPPPPAVSRDVHLAATTVPPGGLITSFIGNQFRYCAIICPLLVDTAVTAAVTTVHAPVTFVTASRSGDLLRAFGAAAASVTGPTNDAAQAAILADGSLVAPRALNAFQVGVVGLLNVLPAAADGLPGVVRALDTAREDTFAALNAPIVANPTPTVRPRGVLQVAVVEAINIVAAVVFPAFNHVLSAVFETPDAFARELAATGDPARAVGAAARALAGRLVAAGTVIAESVDTALRNIGAAVEQSHDDDEPVQTADTGPGAPGPDAGTDAHADVAGAPDDAEALERVRSEPSDGPAVRSHDDAPDSDSATIAASADPAGAATGNDATEAEGAQARDGQSGRIDEADDEPDAAGSDPANSSGAARDVKNDES